MSGKLNALIFVLKKELVEDGGSGLKYAHVVQAKDILYQL
jgi:hypothetical protein